MKKIPMLLFSLAIGIAVMLGVSSCDNGNTSTDYSTTVQGHILEYGTEEPIAGAKVILIEKEVSLSGGISYPIDTLITDETGAYAYRFFDKPGFSYWIDVIKEGYHELPTPFYDFQPNRVNDADILLDPLAWLELHVKNINPHNSNDYFNVNGFPTQGPWYGENVDETLYMEVKGNKDKQLTWFVTKNDSSYNHTEFIYCEGHKVTKYEILY